MQGRRPGWSSGPCHVSLPAHIASDARVPDSRCLSAPHIGWRRRSTRDWDAVAVAAVRQQCDVEIRTWQQWDVHSRMSAEGC
eukprot:470528-Rhodomonas_salina.3